MKRVFTVLALLIVVLLCAGGWYVYSKQPTRQGQVELRNLQGSVTVRYDERGVPHIRAENETDLYRALGYVHAQDRLFQMESMRRLARGELAEVLGPKLLDTDKLFRSLRIRERAASYVASLDKQSPAWKGLQAYLDGINQYQDTHAAPIEFDVLGIPKRPFTAEDSISVAGYMAYSFAAAFRTEPLLTYVRDQLGADYLNVFDLDWQAKGVLANGHAQQTPALAAGDWKDLNALARLSEQALIDNGLPQFEGSNAWVIAGSRSQSGKPLLAGDPHIRFSVPSVWYEAQLSAPGFELYGHHQALVPFAFLGHNLDFGWSLTMFQNDDLDLIAEKVNPDNPNQVWYRGQWTDMVSSEQQINVKGQSPVTITLRQSPHGPIVNDALGICCRQDADCHVVGLPRNTQPDPRRLLSAQPRRHAGQGPRRGGEGAGTGVEPGLRQRQGRYRLVGLGITAQASGRSAAGIHSRRQQQSGRQGRFLPVQRQPAGRESGTWLHRLGQLPAAVADRHGDPRLLQPR
jgi:penicillin amidase